MSRNARVRLVSAYFKERYIHKSGATLQDGSVNELIIVLGLGPVLSPGLDRGLGSVPGLGPGLSFDLLYNEAL